MRTYVQPGPLGKVVCSSASVELEDPVIKQLENVYVGMDSLGPCKLLTSLHEKKNTFPHFPPKKAYYIIVIHQNQTLK